MTLTPKQRAICKRVESGEPIFIRQSLINDKRSYWIEDEKLTKRVFQNLVKKGVIEHDYYDRNRQHFKITPAGRKALEESK